MPAYDFTCDNCLVVGEVFLKLSEYDQPQPCPECGEPMRRVVAAVATVGPMPSKPLTVKQIGRSFESNAELRHYLRKHNTEMWSKDDKAWKDHVDHATEMNERVARRQGFRDAAQFNEFRKKERKRRIELGVNVDSTGKQPKGQKVKP